jgi:hypothetical protein
MFRTPARTALRSLWAVLTLLVLLPGVAAAQDVEIVEGPDGIRLQVDGEDFMVLGQNWDYFPRGTTNPAYNFWGQSDDFIRSALDREMSLMRTMGINAIRVYQGIPPRWVEWIYDNYGIYSIVNHTVGRYGIDFQGRYIPNTDYSNPAFRDQIKGDVLAMVREFQGTRGMLMWLLGNENNYGLVWDSAETEDLPQGEADAVRARYMYSLFGEIVDEIKQVDSDRPVAMANGDLQYLDIIAEEVPNLDVFGSNVYRGESFRDFFQRIDETMGIPVLFTEFGSDRFNARTGEEDQEMQAYYLIEQWEEIYEQSAGKGLVGNAIGGLTFQWTDGWWKFGQTDRLDIQDTNASWSNQAYLRDWEEGENNMNEEWWGIVAKGPTNANGQYELFPRAAFYALKKAYELDPYAPGTDLEAIREHFGEITPAQAAVEALGATAALNAGTGLGGLVTGLRIELETFNTGGERITTTEGRAADPSQYPSFQGFDQLQSFYVDLGAKPAPNLEAEVSLNILGNVPENPIDEIFYENRGRSQRVETPSGERIELEDINRLAVYSASVDWDARDFRLEGFYRSGHYHWGYEGDMFSLYREANYGPNLDIYNGLAPVGVEITGKRSFDGLKVAFGPELWWGANPTLLAKYRRDLLGVTATAVVQEDVAQAGNAGTSFAVPVQKERRATLVLEKENLFGFGVELGGIWSGDRQVGEAFQIVDGEPGNYRVLQDNVDSDDTFGTRARLTWSGGPINWYAQGSAMGIVASGGPTQIQTYTGWRLTDSGSSNQYNFLTGFTYQTGNWQIAPNFMWQKPIIDAIPEDAPAPARLRNVLDDPFAVLGNQETVAGELLFTYDPTPATWMYLWDADRVEDAPLAASFGIVYRSQRAARDASIGILADGRTLFAFPGSPDPEDLWEVHTRIISKRGSGMGIILNAYAGTGQANGNSDRTIDRYGADARIAKGPLRFEAGAKFNDWGPYDYHRDFNLTFPTQLMGDVSYSFGLPDWMNAPQTRLGVLGLWRSLDEFSPRFCPDRTPNQFGSLTCDPAAPGDNGREWEIRTYLHFVL